MSVYSVPIPSGMVEVSQEEFFRRLYAEPRDIVPSYSWPTQTAWLVCATRAQWGWSTPGWREPMDPKRYAVFPEG